MSFATQLLLFYVATYFLISGLDDLSIDLRLLWHTCVRKLRRRTTPLPSAHELQRHPQKRIAIMVPLWQEASVLRAMVETNLRQVEYQNFTVFLGVYPNDEGTVAVARALAAQYSNVHVALCSRPGPTSKADCLNHIYRKIEPTEALDGSRFDIVVLHDAEDVLHPASLALVNWFADFYGMVQVPVLPFPTRIRDWVHGVYCDEFAEFLSRDMRLREHEGAFLPSNGVGTAIRREYLETLRAKQNGILFEADCLTEDYELGMKLASAGCRQTLLPLTRKYGDLLATREYFPRTIAASSRQRSRWISGQCLQSWERHGWPLDLKSCYWFWRDRKGLWANPLSLLALLFVALNAAASLAPEFLSLGNWLWLAGSVPGADSLYFACTLLAGERLLVRMFLVSRIYGIPFALAVPLRMLLSTSINAMATASAFHCFVRARATRRRLSWAKTDHAFPSAPLPQAAPLPSRALALAAGAGSKFGDAAQLPESPGSSAIAISPRWMSAPAMRSQAFASQGLHPYRMDNGEWVLMVSPKMPLAEKARLTEQSHARIVFPDQALVEWLSAAEGNAVFIESGEADGVADVKPKARGHAAGS